MHETVNKIVGSMSGAPFVLALLIINTIMLATFAYTMKEVSAAAVRRDGILEKCLKM
jgi:hypothetical protein